MLLFQHVASHGRDCGFSMDLVERASFEYLAVACHLRDELSDSSWQWQLYKDILRFDLLISLAVSCMISNAELDTKLVYYY